MNCNELLPHAPPIRLHAPPIRHDAPPILPYAPPILPHAPPILPHAPPILPCSSSSSVSHDAYLRLGQAQRAGQLLPLGSDDVVVFLEGSFQTKQLRGRKRRPDPFGFPGERAVKQHVLRTAVLSWTQTNKQTVNKQHLPTVRRGCSMWLPPDHVHPEFCLQD